MGQLIAPKKDNKNGCQMLDWGRDFTAQDMLHLNKTEGFFLLVNRGGCSFKDKIVNAQRLGAEIIIV